MKAFDFQSRTHVVFGEGSIKRLGELALACGFKKTLVVADRGLLASGHVDEAVGPLRAGGIDVICFHDFEVNPDSAMVEAGRQFAVQQSVDSIIGLGGGSSMDCAKGINLVLTNGGSMRDYLGYGKAAMNLRPMIGIPTTAGTGSEAQSYALICDVKTHVKMACGDPKAAFRVAILDPALTVSQPRSITATAGFDAIAHAIETYVTVSHNALSDMFSREAWRLLSTNYRKVLSSPEDIEARGAMQLGAHYAGMAIEHSMLGATHACANPLTARYGTSHGEAIAMLLPSVVRWNGTVAASRYAELLAIIGVVIPERDAAQVLAQELEELAGTGGLGKRLSDTGIQSSDLQDLAAEAAEQWTGRHNPRPFDIKGALEVYENAF